jgi:hypothetical protein
VITQESIKPPLNLDDPNPLGSPPQSPLRVGKRIEVYWTEEEAQRANTEPGWYPGVITKVYKNSKLGTHDVLYDDDKRAGRGPIKSILIDRGIGKPDEWRNEQEVADNS